MITEIEEDFVEKRRVCRICKTLIDKTFVCNYCGEDVI